MEMPTTMQNLSRKFQRKELEQGTVGARGRAGADEGRNSRHCLRRQGRRSQETFPGENESVDEIRKDVCIQSQYQDGQVTADWSFDSYQYVNLEGHVMNDSLEEEEILVKAVVELGC